MFLTKKQAQLLLPAAAVNGLGDRSANETKE